jgi:protein translocase SecG subunit
MVSSEAGLQNQCFSDSIAGMEFIQSVVLPTLPYVQILLSVLLIAAVLLQQRGSSLGGAFGGDNFSSTFHKRRGSELFLFRATIAIAILFVVSTLVSVIF